MKRNKLFKVAIGGLTLVVGLALLTPFPAGAKETMKMAWFLDPTYEVLVYGIRKGKVTSESIDIKLFPLDISALMQATGTKEFDLVETSVVGVPQARDRGLHLLMVGAGIKPKGGRFIFAKSDSALRSLADLKERTFGISSLASTAVVQVRMVLKKVYGFNVALEKGDIKWVEAPLPTLPVLIQRGSLDAAYIIHTPAFKALESKEFKVIGDIVKDYLAAFGTYPIASVLVTYPEKVREKPAAIRELIRVLRASLKYARDNAKEVYEAVAKEHRLDAKNLATQWESWYDFTGTLEEDDQKSLTQQWEGAKEMGMLKAVPDIKEMVWR